MFTDTIAAIATPVGVGGVGIVRVSGTQALFVFCSLFRIEAHQVQPRFMRMGRLFHPDADLSTSLRDQPLDDACGVFFRGPASYTGEDVAEFHLHGNPVVLQNVLGAIFSLGVRPAAAGEFTRRAFIYGKLDLTRAEAVGDLIHAQSESACGVALGHLKGGLYTRISMLRHELMAILEQMEGSIDFPEEVEAWDRPVLVQTLSEIHKRMMEILNLQDFGRIVQGGIHCVIVGRPNVGKSSLLNQLAGENRAIVSSIAGTTRDFIDIRIQLGGLLFEFIDTAGIRESVDKIEALGIKQIRSWISRADWIVWVVDASVGFTAEDGVIFNRLKSKTNVVVVENKSDKKRRIQYPVGLCRKKWARVQISSKTLEGVIPLKSWLVDHFLTYLTDVSADLLCNARQLDCLKQTHRSISQLLEGAQTGFEDAILVIDLKQAVLKLGELTGDEVTEEVLDGVFSRFCVGK